MTRTFTMTYLFATILIVATLLVDAVRLGGRNGLGGRVVRVTSPNTVQRLHETLGIGRDPNQDIRTNRLLNMEGI
jgi:hypothetical protein